MVPQKSPTDKNTDHVSPSEQITKMLPLVKAGAHFVIARVSDKVPIWPDEGKWQKSSPTMPTLYRYGKRDDVIFGIIPSSIGFVVIDIDTDHSAGVDVLREAIVESIGEPVFDTRTRSGGIHMYYRSPFHKKGNEEIRNSDWKWNDETGGQIRGSNGFVVMWSVDSIAGGVEELSEHTKVDLTKWPFNRPVATVTVTTTEPVRKHTPMPSEELERMLSHIDANVRYDEWIRIGMALHSGGYDVSVWDKWSSSATRPDAYKQGACEQHWATFRPGGGVSMGTLWSMAEGTGWTPPNRNSDGQPQWGGEREGAGRPVTDEPSLKTMRNRKSKLRTEMVDWAHENDLIVYHQFDTPVYNDVWRILRYEKKYLLAVDGLMHIANGPVWRMLAINDDVSMNALSLLLSRARNSAVESLPEFVPKEYAPHILDFQMDFRHLREVANTLKVYVDKVEGIPTQYFNDRNQNPVIPFADNSCFHLQKGIWLDRESALSLNMRDCSWNIPNSIEKKVPIKAQEIILRQYGQDLLDRIAIWFTGTDKSCDVSRFRSDGGKTTLYDLLSRAFPGAFAKRNATQALNFSSQRFTPMSKPLVNCIGVFLDEATHSDAQITASVLNAWDSDELEHEEKYQPRVVVKRIGNLMLLGSDEWPHIDSSAQDSSQGSSGYVIVWTFLRCRSLRETLFYPKFLFSGLEGTYLQERKTFS